MARLTDNINLTNELKRTPVSELIENAKTLLSSKGYSQSTIKHYNNNFDDIRHSMAPFNAEKLSEEFIAQYIEQGMGKKRSQTSSSIQRKTLLNLIAKAANTAPVFNYEIDTDKIQNSSLQKNLDAYEQYLRGQDKRKQTIKSSLQIASKFLLYLEKNQKSNLSNVKVIDIQGFITDLGVKWSPRSMRIVPSHLKTYIKFAKLPVDAMFFLNIRVPRKSKPIRAMSNENVETLWEYIEGNDGDLRSKAILTILLATGMRPIDIAELMLNDIDWNNDSISFIQSKTSVGMNVKLFPVIGSTVFRYITEQRPKGTGSNYIFLSKKAPFRRITPSVCNRTIKAAFEKNGISFFADGLHCPRAVRRSLVSRMIAKDIPVQKAAAAIGHVDEESVDLYIELDVAKMRSICLPIPSPIKEWL